MKLFVATRTFNTDEKIVVLKGQLFLVADEAELPVTYHGERYFQEYSLVGKVNEL